MTIQDAGYQAEVVRLANKVVDLWKRKDPNERVMIAISGIPGAGKTTLASEVTNQIISICDEKKSPGGSSLAVFLPMDGFHLYRAQLAAMPDPETAIHRRGAAFTFDSDRFFKLVSALREPITTSSNVIYAPSFDHAVKDPVEDDIAISPESRILIFEGLYLSLDREPWSSAASLMDELWFIDVDREIARSRLVKRHVASGIVPDEAAARHRISSTDFLNADDILQNRLEVQEIIKGY